MQIRPARMEEVEEIVRLEREVATAPHWGEGVYREMVAGGAVRRCLFVACSAPGEGLGGRNYRSEVRRSFRPEVEESANGVGDRSEDIPQRLKPDSSQATYGTPEGVPLSKTRDGTAMNGVPGGSWTDEIVGFAVGRVVGDEGEVESIGVRETEQRRGVGRALLTAVMAWCMAEGAGAIELEVRAGGAAARGLYEATGFAEVGTRPGYYVDPVEDAVLMRWVSGAAER